MIKFKKRHWIYFAVFAAVILTLLSVFMKNYFSSGQLVHAIKDKNYEKLENLSQNSWCDIDAVPTFMPIFAALTEQSVMTPLQTACYNNDTQAVEILVKNGADVNHLPPYGLCDIPPIHLAASHGNAEMMELLLQNGADVLSKYQGKQIMDSLVLGAIRAENVEQLGAGVALLQAYDASTGGNLFVMSGLYGQIPISKYLLTEGLASVDETDEKGRTALHLCLISGHTSPTKEFVMFLIESGVDIAHKDASEKTAYDYALEQGKTELAELLKP